MSSFDQYTDIYAEGSSNGRPIPIVGTGISTADLLHSIGISTENKLWAYAVNSAGATGSLTLRIGEQEETVGFGEYDRRNIIGPDELLRFGVTLSAFCTGGSFTVHFRAKERSTLSTI